MGKDRSGNFHPQKGKPSGSQKEETTDQISTDVQIRHRNRNKNKDEGDNVERTGVSGSYKSRLSPAAFDGAVGRAVDLGEQLDRPTYLELASLYSPGSVSVYMATHSSGKAVNEHEDFIQFRSLIQQADGKLSDAGFDGDQREKILAPANALLADNSFWTTQKAGLAFFVSEDNCYFMRMTPASATEVFVGNTFMAAPLLEHLNENKYFYLLVLSKKHAALHRVSKDKLELIPMPDMPDGVGDVKHFEEMDYRKLTFSDQGGTDHVDYNGSGSGFPEEKENIAIYMREVSNTIQQNILHNENAPLLLAGVEYLLPIFKSVSNYRYISERMLTGNQEHGQSAELHKKALELMKDYLESPVEKALERYANLSAGALTSSIVEDVVSAAYYGKVDQLFIKKGQHVWGSFDPEQNKLVTHSSHQSGDDCLLDKAATATIDMGGEVHFVEEERMPAQSSIAAIMRYDETRESNTAAGS